jgi:hypothetical protein
MLRPELAALLAMALFPPERSGPYVIELPEHMKNRRRPENPRVIQYADNPKRKEWEAQEELKRIAKETAIQAIRDDRKKRKAAQWKKQHPHEQ